MVRVHLSCVGASPNRPINTALYGIISFMGLPTIEQIETRLTSHGYKPHVDKDAFENIMVKQIDGLEMKVYISPGYLRKSMWVQLGDRRSPVYGVRKQQDFINFMNGLKTLENMLITDRAKIAVDTAAQIV